MNRNAAKRAADAARHMMQQALTRHAIGGHATMAEETFNGMRMWTARLNPKPLHEFDALAGRPMELHARYSFMQSLEDRARARVWESSVGLSIYPLGAETPVNLVRYDVGPGDERDFHVHIHHPTSETNVHWDLPSLTCLAADERLWEPGALIDFLTSDQLATDLLESGWDPMV
jgi:hypothetical protein